MELVEDVEVVDVKQIEASLVEVGVITSYSIHYTKLYDVFQTAASLGKNLVVLAGDTHNAWASELKMFDASYQPTIPVGVEFATTSVTSPGMEEYAGLTDTASAMQFEAVITALIDDLKYFNANNRGFMSVTFTKDAATAEWVFVDSVASEAYGVLTTRSKKLKTVAGSASLTAV